MQAHRAGDRARLVSLYRQAAEDADAQGRSEAAAFYMTHAYVFALESGDPRAAEIHAALKAWGKEQ